MFIKKLMRILLILAAGLLSINVQAKVKYPAYDFQPKIIFQNEDVKRIANPPKPQAAETPPIRQLLFVLLLGGAGAYFYKTKFQTPSKTTTMLPKRSTDKAVIARTDAGLQASNNTNPAPVKRITKNHRGYRSPRLLS